MRALNIVIANIVIILILLISFDVAGYFLLPKNYILGAYRSKAMASRGPVGGMFFPRDYFVAHPSRGFDIRPADNGGRIDTSFYFPIEANRFGCRDRDFVAVANRPYVYLAGDSHTWGYTPSSSRWSALLERKLETPVLNCGVPGTAQRHQQEKYRDVTRALGQAPSLVLVGYSPNDVGEDFDHPTRTVIEGHLVNRPIDSDATAARVRNEIAKLENPALMDRVRYSLKQFSLSSHIIKNVYDRLRDGMNAPAVETVYSYGQPEAGANKSAIENFFREACGRQVRFAMVILPHSQRLNYPDYYAELTSFLASARISHVDLHKKLASNGVSYSDLSFPLDPHFSVAGNHLVAEALYEEMQGNAKPIGACS
jgi:hypothetical protein